MKNVFLFASFFFVTLALAQKSVQRTYNDPTITGIYIDSDQIFEIHLTTSSSQEIIITTQIDGETYEATVLKSKVDDKTLFISTGKTPDFTPFNDKLGAHKVLSIVVSVALPIDMDVTIKSTLAQVHLTGDYGNLQLDLGRGGVQGERLRFRESVLNTISGSIFLTLEKAQVTAKSRNGTINIAPFFNEGPPCRIESVYGNIAVQPFQ